MSSSPQQVEARENRIVAQALRNYANSKTEEGSLLDEVNRAEAMASPQTLDLAERGMKNKSPEIRGLALAAAADVASDSQDPALAQQARNILRKAALEDPVDTVRIEAAKLISLQIDGRDPAVARTFVDTLQHGLSDPDPKVRIAFIERCMSLHKTIPADADLSDTAFEMSKNATKDPDPAVRAIALVAVSSALVESNGLSQHARKAKAVLDNAVETDPDPRVQTGIGNLMQYIEIMNDQPAPQQPKAAPGAHVMKTTSTVKPEIPK